MYEFKAKLTRVVDGDTLVFDLDLGFDVWLNNQHIRLADINCPEVRTKDLQEKERGLAAKVFVEDICDEHEALGGTFVVKTVKFKQSFTRYVGYVYLIDNNIKTCLNEMIVANGHGEVV